MKLFNEGQINVIKHKKGEQDDLIIAEFRDDVIKRNTSMLIAEIKYHSKESRSTFTKPFEEEIVEMYEDKYNNKIILLINLNIDDLLLTDIYNELLCMRLNLADKLNSVITILLNVEENNKLNYDDSYNMKEDIFKYDSSNKTITKITKGDEKEMSIIRETIFDNEENIQTIIDKVTSCKKSKSLVLYINLNTDKKINGAMYHIEPQLKQSNVKTPLIISNEDEMESILKSVYSKDINLYCILDRGVSIGDNDIDSSKNVANYLEKLKIMQSKGIDVSIIINGGVKLSSKQNKERCEMMRTIVKPILYENRVNIITSYTDSCMNIFDLIRQEDDTSVLIVDLDEDTKFNTEYYELDCGMFSDAVPTSIHVSRDLELFSQHMEDNDNCREIVCVVYCDSKNINVKMKKRIESFILKCKNMQSNGINITLVVDICKDKEYTHSSIYYKIHRIEEMSDNVYDETQENRYYVIKHRGGRIYDKVDEILVDENTPDISRLSQLSYGLYKDIDIPTDYFEFSNDNDNVKAIKLRNRSMSFQDICDKYYDESNNNLDFDRMIEEIKNTDDVVSSDSTSTSLGTISKMRNDLFDSNIKQLLQVCTENIPEIPSVYLDEEGHYSLSKHFIHSREEKKRNKYSELKQSLEYISKAVDKFREISTDDKVPTIVTLTFERMIDEMRKRFNE